MSLLVVPTMTHAGPGLHTDDMSPGPDDTPIGDAQRPPDWQQVQTLGVPEIVMTILEARKTMPSATAAAVSREKHGGGIRVRVSLLEATPPPDWIPQDPGAMEGVTAIFVARQLGKDLADAFGGKDVIILT